MGRLNSNPQIFNRVLTENLNPVLAEQRSRYTCSGMLLPAETAVINHLASTGWATFHE